MYYITFMLVALHNKDLQNVQSLFWSHSIGKLLTYEHAYLMCFEFITRSAQV
jgi:hypothetical protein